MCKNIKLEDYYIAYIDFLGVKNMIKSYTDDNFISLCKKISDLVKSIIKSIESNAKYIPNYKIEFHMFSDNIIFISDDCSKLFDFIALLQRRIYVQLHLILKGGFTHGSLYYEPGHFILGKGLLDAYELENSHHRPGIYISPIILVKYDCDNYIQKTDDGGYIIDYLEWSTQYDPIEVFNYEIPIHKNIIENNLSTQTELAILEKYKWLKGYHNKFCTKHGLNFKI